VILVDSSAWIEHMMNGDRADSLSEYVNADSILVPTSVLYEVYKFARRELGEDAALAMAARFRKFGLVPLDETLALEAAEASLRYRLAFADAVVYATAQYYGATLVTLDRHFADLADVVYLGDAA
jgi:predicted nucleic acid-binding protein